jgi:transposase InsO family protein
VDHNKLPFIYVPIPGKKEGINLLIDTGSSNSFIDPAIASKMFSKHIKNNPIVVTTVLQEHIIPQSIEIPAFSIFSIPHPLELKFHLLKFHNYFDGLIGLDTLEKLKADLHLVKSLLVTPYCSIALRYIRSNKPPIMSYDIPPRQQQFIKLPVNIDNGDIIIPYTKIHECEIPETLTKSKANFAMTSIINKSDKPIKFDLFKPIRVESFNQMHTSQLFNMEYNELRNKKNTLKTKFDFSKLRLDHLNIEERTELLNVIQNYSEIFYNDKENLTFTNQIKHRIKTKDEIPVYTKTYRYPFVHKQEVQNQMKSMLAQGIIQPSESPWSSPIWIVPKKLDASGKRKWRVVIDYRKVNEKTIDDRYPLPNISDVLDKLGKANYFTTLDLASGFHQIEIHPDDVAKTAFNTEHGHYEFKRMPFGLKNAPATLQRIMDNILRGIQNEKCLVYLDDIIIFSTSLKEHIENLKSVFERLKQTNFKIQLDKSEFLRKEVNYLGHVITPNGVKPNPDKIHAVKNYPIPKNQKQIKSFLGLLGYYRKFIKDFAKITKPLTQCLKKDSKVEHTNEFVDCFNLCKNLLINDPILQYPDFEKPFNLTCDSSNYAMGAILSQGPIGSDLPVAYASRTLNEHEINYSVIEKELLSIVWSTKFFRPYLYGRKFKILSDHKPLQWLFSLKEPNSKLVRWRLRLEEFDYDIIYKNGKLNTNADALSRVEIHAKEESKNIFDYMENFNQQFQSRPDETESLQVQVDEDEINDMTVHTNDSENPVVDIPIIETPLNYAMNQIIVTRVYHSPAQVKIIKLFDNKQRLHVQISKDQDVINFVKEYLVPKVSYIIYFEDNDIYEPFCEIIRKTFKYPSYILKRTNSKLIDIEDPDELQNIIKNYHEGKTNHRGSDETENRIKQKYYWPQLRKTIQNYINKCDICRQCKYDRKPIKPKFNITPTPTKPFEILHMDTFQAENRKFLTIIDTFSKYAQAYALNSLNSLEIVNSLLIFFAHHGIPKSITTDNGSEFKNVLLQELLSLHKINIHFITPHHPESNSPVERFHSTLLEHIRLLNTQGFQEEPIQNKILYSVLAYNNSIHSVTQFKPMDLINGHISADNPFDLNIEKELLNDYIERHKNFTQKLYSNLNIKLADKKQKLISKRNDKREEIEITPQQEINERKFIRQKTSNKYKPLTTVKQYDPAQKIIITNADRQIHIANIKRPPNISKSKF